jgi:hypothetical protein
MSDSSWSESEDGLEARLGVFTFVLKKSGSRVWTLSLFDVELLDVVDKTEAEAKTAALKAIKVLCQDALDDLGQYRSFWARL